MGKYTLEACSNSTLKPPEATPYVVQRSTQNQQHSVTRNTWVVVNEEGPSCFRWSRSPSTLRCDSTAFLSSSAATVRPLRSRSAAAVLSRTGRPETSRSASSSSTDDVSSYDVTPASVSKLQTRESVSFHRPRVQTGCNALESFSKVAELATVDTGERDGELAERSCAAARAIHLLEQCVAFCKRKLYSQLPENEEQLGRIDFTAHATA
jgi:hypothetical protein